MIWENQKWKVKSRLRKSKRKIKKKTKNAHLIPAILNASNPLTELHAIVNEASKRKPSYETIF